MTIHEFVQGARERFERSGINRGLAARDAEVLARQVLGWDAARFLADRDTAASSSFVLRYEPLVARRERREPVSYILGRREFWGLDLEVGPDVLIPRPESELIVEEALALIAPDAAPLVVDVGTGSGCLAIALARELPAARVIATDVCDRALATARRNAGRHGLDARMDFVKTSFLEGIDDTPDLIVSNPPYVPSVSAPGLTPEVRDYEPGIAVFAGEDGLDAVRALTAAAAAALTPGGWLVMEFGYGQEDGVLAVVAAAGGLEVVKVRADLQDIPRVIVCRSAR